MSEARRHTLGAAIAAAMAAREAVELMPDERPDDVSEETWEAGCEVLIRAEGASREFVRRELAAALGPAPHAVILHTGHILAVADQADGLAIVPPDRVARLAPGPGEAGATGEYPEGAIGPDDEGELKARVATDRANRRILVDFGKPVKWLYLTGPEARSFALYLLEKAKAIS